ncbi:Clp protease N-terminal domain-containing protein [Streptomyces sp. NPDC054834]
MVDFERFSDDTKHVVVCGDRAARELKHSVIDTGHLLLGLIAAAGESGTGSEIENLLGISSAQIRGGVVGALGLGKDQLPKHLPFSSEAKAVVQEAPSEADRLGQASVEPIHILLALIAQDGGTAVRVLRANGVDLSRVRQSIIQSETRSAQAAPRRLLDTVTRVLTLDSGPVVGRSHEIGRVIQILSRHQRNTPLLIGAPGVGKEAVAAGVANTITEGLVPTSLRNRTVRALDLGSVLADSQRRAQGAALITELLDEVSNSPNLILYLNGALAALHLPDGTTSPLALFRPLLDAPGVLVFGDCGRAEYERRDPDPGLDRFVQPVPVEEPPEDDVREILRTVRKRLEAHHNAALSDEALLAAAVLARGHVPDQSLPGAAIDLLDEAAALARLQAARSGTASDEPLSITETDVRRALAAYSGIQSPAHHPSPAPAPAPAEHDPYIWAMS